MVEFNDRRERPENMALDIQVEAARRKAAEDHDVSPDSVRIAKVKENPRYDPEHRAMDHEEFKANNYRYPPHTEPEGRATHTAEFIYNSQGHRALYGVNVHQEKPPELWAD